MSSPFQVCLPSYCPTLPADNPASLINVMKANLPTLDIPFPRIQSKGFEDLQRLKWLYESGDFFGVIQNYKLLQQSNFAKEIKEQLTTLKKDALIQVLASIIAAFQDGVFSKVIDICDRLLIIAPELSDVIKLKNKALFYNGALFLAQEAHTHMKWFLVQKYTSIVLKELPTNLIAKHLQVQLQLHNLLQEHPCFPFEKLRFEHEARKAYLEGNFSQAILLFQMLKQIVPREEEIFIENALRSTFIFQSTLLKIEEGWILGKTDEAEKLYAFFKENYLLKKEINAPSYPILPRPA